MIHPLSVGSMATFEVSFLDVHRLRECAFNGPPFSKPGSNKIPGNVNFISPFRHALNRSSKLNKHVVSSVSVLLPACSPANIAGFIVAVFIWPAIKGESGWTRPHVFEKAFEGDPPGADRYSAPAVIVKRMALRVVAAIHHCHPASILSGAGHPVGSSGISDPRPGRASARSCLAGPKAVVAHKAFCSTFASTPPEMEIVPATSHAAASEVNHAKLGEDKTCEIDKTLVGRHRAGNNRRRIGMCMHIGLAKAGPYWEPAFALSG